MIKAFITVIVSFTLTGGAFYISGILGVMTVVAQVIGLSFYINYPIYKGLK